MAYKRRWGFTIIEMITVVAIIGVTLPAVFAIIFNLLRLSLQLSQLQRVKEVGDYITNQITQTVRTNAVRIDSTCATGTLHLVPSGTNYLLFRDRSDTCFGYSLISSGSEVTLASVSAALPIAYNYSTTLVTNASSDNYPLTVEDLHFTEINLHLARVSFDLVSNPTVDYLQPQRLSYRFYLYIRN